MRERLVALEVLAPLKEPVEALQRERNDQRGGAADDEDDAAVLQRRERELLKDDVHLGRGGGAGRHAHVGLRDLRGEGGSEWKMMPKKKEQIRTRRKNDIRGISLCTQSNTRRPDMNTSQPHSHSTLHHKYALPQKRKVFEFIP
jgi:hypothetical protein